MSSIAFWNCRGARKNKASRYLKEFVKEFDIFFVGLVETKISSVKRDEFNKVIGVSWDFFLFHAEGLSGGIMVCWRSDVGSFSVLEASSQVVVGELSIPSKGVWLVATVYGSKDTYKRRILLKSLEAFSDRSLPFIVGGDFNCILSQKEKRGEKNFVFSQGHEFIHEQRALKAIFFWSKSKHENLNILKDRLKKEILELQEEEADRGLSDVKIYLLKSKVLELNSTLGRLNTWWRQRAKVKWIEEGDTNSKFFHAFASARRNSNQINQIKDNKGNLVEDQSLIKDVFYELFIDKWKERRCVLRGWPPTSHVLDELD
ncbi:hypothetical protein M5K25_013720 [Dendrobium thyrsiflorum]|uniref:Endonuclease/exonuclease/phosphatase domain-containing protein n=1 Tax=Dendrobium thyrsiflorum TaxID=117978 RepID=A0ABD0V0J3_DENTH